MLHTSFAFLQRACHADAVRMLVALLLAGAIALPLFPFWDGAFRVVVMLGFLGAIKAQSSSLDHQAAHSSMKLSYMLLASAVAFVLYTILWANALWNDPFNLAQQMLKDIYGTAISIWANAALTTGDVLLVSLGMLLLYRKWFSAMVDVSSPRILTQMSIASLAAFAGWSFVATMLAAFERPQDAAAVMAGFSRWMIWVMIAQLVLLMIKTKEHVHILLRGIVIGGVIVAAIITLQWLVGDFSYVLDGVWFDEYFYRVRGTYYYYTPASMAVATTAMLAIALVKGTLSRQFKILALIAFMVSLACLNGSRGLAVGIWMALMVVAAGFAYGKSYRAALVWLTTGLIALSFVQVAKPMSGDFSRLKRLNEACSAIQSAIPPKPKHHILAETDDQNTYDRDGDHESGRVSTHISGHMAEHIAEMHTGRRGLFYQGVMALQQSIWFGRGIGKAHIDLAGDMFNGLASTYSSHMLYLDMALMAGLPAVIIFASFFGIAVWCGIRQVVLRLTSRHDDEAPSPHDYTALGLLAGLMIFMALAAFLGQENDHLVLLGVINAVLLIVYHGLSQAKLNLATQPPSTEPVAADDKQFLRRFVRWGYGMIALASLMWCVLTSASYVFPVIEFVARHHQELAQSKEPVYVNHPVPAGLLGHALKWMGITSEVNVLRDGVREPLPPTPSWLIWNYAFDKDYPHLRCRLGYSNLRKFTRSPSIAFPSDWWTILNIQSASSTLYIGRRSLPPQAIQDMDMDDIPATWDNLTSATITKEGYLYDYALGDLNLGTYYPLYPYNVRKVILHLPKDRHPVAYRLYPTRIRLVPTHMTYSWKVSSSSDKRRWQSLAKYQKFPLGQYQEKGRFFALHIPENDDYIKFEFWAPGLKIDAGAGIAELELFTR